MIQTNAKPIVKLDIDALSYGPYGIGRVDGKAVMVPHTAPGDQIEARITESKERYAIGEIVRLLRPSSARQSPPLPLRRRLRRLLLAASNVRSAA